MTDPADIPPAARIGPNGETAIELATAAVAKMCAAMGAPVPDDLPGPIDSQVDPANDPVATPPTFASRFGRAWLCDIAAAKADDQRPDAAAGIANWIIEAPWANCAWHSYMVAVIHLRPIEGGEPATIRLPGATHEVFVIALDSRRPREQSISAAAGVGMLTPVNFVGQFIAENDAAAFERVERDVQAIVAGDLNPDTDSRSAWVARYGSSGLKS